MCGIVGMLELDGARSPSRHVLESMTAALAHRGPDEHGVWVDGCVGLAARRLRVVDLVTGQQPLVNEDGSVRLVANGEIYNAGELRDDLRRKGHLFTTRTDIEVILHAYEDEGPACLERLEGMFAFALWDSRRQRLVLARDRFGEKPLYYARLSRTLLFASEPKALLMHPRVSRELDWTALARYLTYDYVPAPHAIFRAVRKLPPAHWRAAAAAVAARLGTEHHEVVRTPTEARELLPDVARIFDEPFADATALPAVLLARLARRHVTVTLSGDGADELFCGYPTQTAHGAADLDARVQIGRTVGGLRGVAAEQLVGASTGSGFRPAPGSAASRAGKSAVSAD